VGLKELGKIREEGLGRIPDVLKKTKIKSRFYTQKPLKKKIGKGKTKYM